MKGQDMNPYQKFVESEIAKWAVPIRAAGVTAE
jgi:hypothetical protein